MTIPIPIILFDIDNLIFNCNKMLFIPYILSPSHFKRFFVSVIFILYISFAIKFIIIYLKYKLPCNCQREVSAMKTAAMKKVPTLF